MIHRQPTVFLNYFTYRKESIHEKEHHCKAPYCCPVHRSDCRHDNRLRQRFLCFSGENGQVIVYNWGEYVDPDTITMFEEETGIKVVYDEFETNEIMYPKVETGASEYDVICPSDYMISKMIESDLLSELKLG